MSNFPEMFKVWAEFGKKQIQNARANLTRYNKKGSGSLYNNMDFRVDGDFEDGMSIIFTMPNYAKFVDIGVKGTKNEKKQKLTPLSKSLFNVNKTPTFKKSKKMIPPKSLISWIKSKGIKGRDEKGRFITHQSLSFAMAIAIHKRGLEGTEFFSRPLLKNMEQFKKDIADAFAKDVENYLKIEDK
ncbi:MAG: hypothetical protein GOVbin7581_28 [Prokaryotic dsDNA virus sp.]|nr:MAG: hypothetical protein GOVbin7581_28 [Prokaryotic dsDNA virus sp.]|tara:strand:+ start:5560 stop:6114 length:555 start_codon:yes stop_codon:yes gene_type:complete